MKPEDRYPTNRFTDTRNTRIQPPDRSSYATPRPQSQPQPQPQQQAAANIVREKLDNIYDEAAKDYQQNQAAPANAPTDGPAPTPANPLQQQDLSIENPYERTRSATPKAQADQWKQYHTAWQNYYQKYYERYYIGKIQEANQKPDTTNPESDQSATEQPQITSPQQQDTLIELRRKLRDKVHSSATKVRSSNHFIPIISALAVVLLFVFLQYNRVIISSVRAYTSPGSIDPQNIVVDPTASIEVSEEPKLIIPKINVDVPVVYGIGPDNDSQMKAMENGVAHFAIPGANSTPGQVGNTVISGHSSNDLFDSGNYKFVFAHLDRLNIGDMIYANYEGIRYSYTVTKKEVVMPTEVDKLIYDTDSPVMTLITCTPLGTAEKRLLISAEQVSPDPAAARPADTSAGDASATIMPSNSPTLIERLFGR